MNADFATARVLWGRDLVRFFRERSRVVGALVQPLLFWFVIGSGFSPTFQLAGAEGVAYREYFFPGVLLMVVLFTSIFATMSLIEDRSAGFLQAVLVGPGSRLALVLGKTFGTATVAFTQCALFVLLAPFAGFSYAQIDWPLLVLVLALTSIMLASIGFAVAWIFNSTQGYHVVMSVLLLPAWIASGAMFPVPARYASLLLINPMAYASSAIRHAFYGGSAPAATVVVTNTTTAVLALVALTVASLSLAVVVCRRRA